MPYVSCVRAKEVVVIIDRPIESVIKGIVEKGIIVVMRNSPVKCQSKTPVIVVETHMVHPVPLIEWTIITVWPPVISVATIVETGIVIPGRRVIVIVVDHIGFIRIASAGIILLNNAIVFIFDRDVLIFCIFSVFSLTLTVGINFSSISFRYINGIGYG